MVQSDVFVLNTELILSGWDVLRGFIISADELNDIPYTYDTVLILDTVGNG